MGQLQILTSMSCVNTNNISLRDLTNKILILFVITLVYTMAKAKFDVIVTLLCIIGATSGYDLMNKQNTKNLYMTY